MVQFPFVQDRYDFYTLMWILVVAWMMIKRDSWGRMFHEWDQSMMESWNSSSDRTLDGAFTYQKEVETIPFLGNDTNRAPSQEYFTESIRNEQFYVSSLKLDTLPKKSVHFHSSRVPERKMISYECCWKWQIFLPTGFLFSTHGGLRPKRHENIFHIPTLSMGQWMELPESTSQVLTHISTFLLRLNSSQKSFTL